MNIAKINFGILLPTREAIMSGRADPSTLYQIAELAESLGFHSVWVGDSLTARPRIDALTTLAAVGARTQRVRLGTAIFLAALRNPILLAYLRTRHPLLSRPRSPRSWWRLRTAKRTRFGA